MLGIFDVMEYMTADRNQCVQRACFSVGFHISTFQSVARALTDFHLRNYVKSVSIVPHIEACFQIKISDSVSKLRLVQFSVL